MPRAVAEVLIHHVAVAVVAGEELAALEKEDAALSEELLTCGRDYVRAQQIAARQTEIAAKSDALYEEYGTLID